MGEPLRIRCETPDDLPPGSDLVDQVSRERQVVLHLPKDGSPDRVARKAATIRLLAAQLPEDFNVFDSGGSADGSTCITVVRVIARSEVIRYEAEIVEAALLFRETAAELCSRLACRLRVPLSWFWTRLLRAEVSQSGRLDADWRYAFHGMECCFGNRSTGQVVEVCLGYEEEFGVLDPYFFNQFVQRTPGCEAVAALFQDSFHDCCRALEILEARDRLQRVQRLYGPRSGLVVRRGP